MLRLLVFCLKTYMERLQSHCGFSKIGDDNVHGTSLPVTIDEEVGLPLLRKLAAAFFKTRQKNSWVSSGSGSLPSE